MKDSDAEQGVLKLGLWAAGLRASLGLFAC